MSNRFFEVRDGFADFLRTSPSLTEFKLVRTILGGQIGTVRPESSADFPALYFALLSARKLTDMNIGGPSHVSLEYMLEFGLVVHVNSDEFGSPDGDDWRLIDAVANALAPHQLASPNFSQLSSPVLDHIDSILVGTNGSGLYAPFGVKIQWTT